MIMVDYFKLVVTQRYAKFDGRAGRAEFWWYALATFIIFAIAAILMQISSIFVILYVVIALGLIVPNLAVSVRRLHDTNKTGWLVLISLIPLVGTIILIVFLATPGNPGPNQYGAPDPGLPAAAAT